ncbi:spore germination protein [Paenibacillus baekrokdamisoli]|uniref:Spore germination protein n=1 Tax=Paenibacillus baekrokdamisoli TaxID=1712516 RepID=A0A3G9J0L1_9BACL|nr:spore germination protein [Paenibacillus baekrokdamisoli]MBB3071935.1 spore germination protein [Paenibacillus baekrokdamisoli]BBH24082.1 spore germination protein [Paenibacillus baekrokdamisoli]
MNFFERWFGGKKTISKKKLFSHNLNQPISESLAINLDILKQLFSYTPDLVIRHIQLKTGNTTLLVYLDGLIDKESVENHILHPLIHELDSMKNIESSTTIGKTETVALWLDIEQSIFEGKSILFINEHPHALALHTQGWPQRAIQEPQIESTLKGSHQGFVETSGQNIALIRRYLPNREMKIKESTVGSRAKTRISMLYLEDVVQPDFVKEMEDRLQQIDVDAVLNTGELVEFIEDHPFSLFPQLALTERPDSAASHILQGRIALIVDHSPSVIIAPVNFSVFFQSIDDYSNRWIIASFIRLLRYLAFITTISLSAIYISIVSFHYELLPLDLLLSIGESRARVPFPPIIEALLMELSLEMLREAGLRLPGPIGQTIGVVGGIVIGQAAVQAGIVSNIMVIIVALTAISSFIVPDYDMSSSLRLLRFPMMFLASLFGMVGIVIGLMIIGAHLISMESFGVPYGSPIVPIRLPDWKDVWIRMPMWKMKNRPLSNEPTQLKRQGANREGEKQQ